MSAEFIHPVDPANGQPLPPVPVTTPEGLAQVVADARAAARGWAALSFDERRGRLSGFAAAIKADPEPLVQQVVQEMGKPVREARAEVRGVGLRFENLAKTAEAAIATETGAEAGIRVDVHWRPLGVVAVIGPWNYPVATPNNLVMSALLTGNAVVLKPSEFTPHTGAMYHRLLAQHVPAGVFGLVQGTGAVGAGLVGGDVDMVAFTGSIATGQAIMRAAAHSMKRLVLELGGKDPMIVLPGADLEAAARHAAIEATRNAGQVCVAVERVIVHQDVAAAFSRRVAEVVRGLKVGDPRDEQTDLGPMANARQRELVLAQLAAAKAAGRGVPGRGRGALAGLLPLTPSVVVGVTPAMDLARNETFGPVVAIQVARDADEAVARANDTIYGLGASVWGPRGPGARGDRGEDPGGMVGVNRGLSTAGGAPWVGWKMSGFGYTRSASGCGSSFSRSRGPARTGEADFMAASFTVRSERSMTGSPR
jgi:acyl-CoA reductase-like NAD-dependent aldehyde dehydrogenase